MFVKDDIKKAASIKDSNNQNKKNELTQVKKIKFSKEELKNHKEMASSLQPFMEKYCIDCHNGDKHKGEIRLDNLDYNKKSDSKDLDNFSYRMSKKAGLKMLSELRIPEIPLVSKIDFYNESISLSEIGSKLTSPPTLSPAVWLSLKLFNKSARIKYICVISKYVNSTKAVFGHCFCFYFTCSY